MFVLLTTSPRTKHSPGQPGRAGFFSKGYNLAQLGSWGYGYQKFATNVPEVIMLFLRFSWPRMLRLIERRRIQSGAVLPRLLDLRP